jgi:hypothetical protein
MRAVAVAAAVRMRDNSRNCPNNDPASDAPREQQINSGLKARQQNEASSGGVKTFAIR